ncbi:tetratricopeptide (TPR) repeat protein [Povalibacter uvarum]|uniref:Tetratricopeptide (TPR) repeat protein n=1 Tax=Povalibacter uvarum TaxID=732238 RepID=A0A841HR05_9GAMM|nr:tetratricopeptide repeat protein [Povalibacter uvarum]MBB6095064.1 tetratricopeptide (TPR) repeat protein [Povalibacter uvarum]
MGAAVICGLIATWSGMSAAQPVAQPSWQQEYWARFDNKDWDAAIASAEQLVAASRPATADTGLRLSEALSLLGGAQLNKGNLVAAEQAFTEAVQLAEKYGSRTSAALIDPLRGLGYTLATQNKHAQAIPYMDRALLISRRSAGLFDLSQQGLLRQLADSLTRVGAAPEAERHMQYVLRVGEHVYGEDDPRMVPLFCVVGDWYLEVGLVEPARQLYRQGVSLASRKLGADHVGVVQPLLALAQSFPKEIVLSHLGIVTRSDKLPQPETTMIMEPMNPRYLSGEGERALLRALKILETTPDRSVQTYAGALVQTGDWFMFKQTPARSMPYYEQAAKLIAEAKGQDAANLQSLLSFPAQVYYPIPSLATRNLNRPPNEVVERFVQLEFTVHEDGSVSDERVVGQDATERQVSQSLEAIRSSRYRPKFVDGKPIVTTAVGFRQIFRQRGGAKETE